MSKQQAVVRKIVEQAEAVFFRMCLEQRIPRNEALELWLETKENNNKKPIVTIDPNAFVGYIPGLHDPFCSMGPNTVRTTVKAVLNKRCKNLGADSKTEAELVYRTQSLLQEFISGADLRTILKKTPGAKGVLFAGLEQCHCVGTKCLCPCTCGKTSPRTNKGCVCVRSRKFWIYKIAARSVEEWRTERRKCDQDADRALAAERQRLKDLDPDNPDNDPEPQPENGNGPRLDPRKDPPPSIRQRKYRRKLHGLSSRPDEAHMLAVAQGPPAPLPKGQRSSAHKRAHQKAQDAFDYAASILEAWKPVKAQARVMSQSEWDAATNPLHGGFSSGNGSFIGDVSSVPASVEENGRAAAA
jgi:hypothetical protein